MKYQYSVAICPSPFVIELFKKLKRELREALKNRYGSVNSEAHISLFEFLDSEVELVEMEKFLIQFCKNIAPFSIRLDKFGRMQSTYCVLPNKQSKAVLANIMEQLHIKRPGTKGKLFKDPHASIGRELSEAQLVIAEELFGKRKIMVDFVCDQFVIRRRVFDSNDQFEIYKEIKLTGKSLMLF